MGMKDPAPTFTELISRVRDLYLELAYLYLVEPCVNGFEPREVQPGESNDFLRNIWGSRPLISTGGYDREVAISTAKDKGGLVGFGRYFVANVSLHLVIFITNLVDNFDEA
jgi:NADPH2 dehydrogenase